MDIQPLFAHQKHQESNKLYSTTCKNGNPAADGLGYFSNISKYIKYFIFNYSGEKCVKLVKNVLIISVEVPTVYLDEEIIDTETI